MYSNRALRGTTPPGPNPPKIWNPKHFEDLPKQITEKPKKVLKKQHKRLTSPRSDDINCVREFNLGKTKPGAHEGTKKAVLLPPMPDEPDQNRCFNCGKAAASGRRNSHACLKCHRLAFCSTPCSIAQVTVFCSIICREENMPIQDDQDEAMDDWDLFSDEDEDVDMGSPPYELSDDEDEEEQREVKKPPHGYRKLHEEHDPEKWDIADFEISLNGRRLNYLLQNVEDQENFKSVPASDLSGDSWTLSMRNFWKYNPEARERRELHCHPFGDMTGEPGTPFGLHILSARFEDDRFLDFNFRENETREPDEEGDHSIYQQGVSLGPEWDEEIKKYWKRVKIEQAWVKREKKLMEMPVMATVGDPDEKMSYDDRLLALSTAFEKAGVKYM